MRDTRDNVDRSTSTIDTDASLISSDRVEGTKVFDQAGKGIGTVKRLMIEKVGGRVVYTVASFGGFLGLGGHEFTLPWSMLTYDTRLGGYRTGVTEAQLRGAPDFSEDEDSDWSFGERDNEAVIHDYYGAEYYWK